MRRAVVVGVGLVLGVLGLWPASQSHAAPSAPTETKLLSARDHRIALEAFKLIDKEKWSEAERLAARLSDPLLKKTLRWLDMARPNGKASFDEIAAFLDTNPGWPRGTALRRRAEEAMTVGIPPEKVLGWFQAAPPLGVDGEIRLIAALFAFGRGDEAKARIHDTWINGDMGRVQEKSFLAQYGRYITKEDHAARLDRLLWDGRLRAARYALWRAHGAERAVGEARFLLRHGRGNVDRAVSHVPKEFQDDPGLVYERVRWRRRKGKLNDALDLLLSVKGPVPRPDVWWDERAILARWALRNGRITDAYRLAHDHGLDDRYPADLADAEWLAGWIALRFLGDNDVAYAHFTRMFATVRLPLSSARGAYWAARAAEAQHRPDLARQWHTTAARYQTTFYGQLSYAVLHPGERIKLAERPQPTATDRLEFDANELVRVVHLLAELGQKDRVRPFVETVAREKDSESWRMLAAELAVTVGRNDLGLRVAKQARQDGQDLADAAFPVLSPPHLPKSHDKAAPEAPLTLAIIRQESAFQVDATSRAGARGLMQLLPSTARKVSKRLRLPFVHSRLTDDADYNMTLGQAYIGELLDDFNGATILAVAAYNAGPSRARAWIRENGDPREAGIDPIDWIESIPFNETRNYVQRVLEGLHIYRMQLGSASVAFVPEFPTPSSTRN